VPLHRARLRISDYAEKRKSRLKHQERRIRMVSLSLTSMVDMFAILVIFLLVNTSTITQWIEVSHNIELPRAGMTDPPQKAPAIQISLDGIFGDEKLLVSAKESLKGTSALKPVRQFLAQFSSREGFVNIVAHTRVPFGVVRRVINTCQDVGFGKVNLAVQPIAGKN
jgi:biopolymer transport protein TolR